MSAQIFISTTKFLVINCFSQKNNCMQFFNSLKFFSKRCILGDWTCQLTYQNRGRFPVSFRAPLRLLFTATNRPAITNLHRGEGREVRQWVSHLGRKNSFTPFKRSFLPSMGNPLRICHITNSMPGRRKIIAGREENNNPKKNQAGGLRIRGTSSLHTFQATYP